MTLFAALMGISGLLRVRAIDAGYWIDEGISVGIASQPLADLPALLRLDGSPPLHYALLHGWMAWLGDGERATHALSLAFALATIPAALWAARPLGRAAWVAAALAAVNPFLTQYAQETRPYALAALLSTLLAGACLRAFLLGDRRALPLVALLGAALALTHHWGLHLLLGLGIATALFAPGRRRAVRDGALVAAGAIVLYLPWLPVTIDQVAHTGAPWSITPGIAELSDVLLVVLGGVVPSLVLLAALVVAAGRARDGSRSDDGRIAGFLAVALVVAFAAAFVAARLEPGWAGRYLAVLVGPWLLLAAWATARAGAAGGIALVVVIALWAGAGTPQPKSNVREVAERLRPEITAGDLVIVAHPEQVAVVRHYLGGSPRYATTLGPQPEPRLFDWRDALRRLRAADPAGTLARVRAQSPAARRIVLVLPVTARTENRRTPWVLAVRARARAWQRLLEEDPRLRRLGAHPAPGTRPPRRGVRVVLYAIAGGAGTHRS